MLAFVAMLAWEGFNTANAVTDTEASLTANIMLLVSGLSGPRGRQPCAPTSPPTPPPC